MAELGTVERLEDLGSSLQHVMYYLFDGNVVGASDNSRQLLELGLVKLTMLGGSLVYCINEQGRTLVADCNTRQQQPATPVNESVVYQDDGREILPDVPTDHGFRAGDVCPCCGSTLSWSAYNRVICLKSSCHFDSEYEREKINLQAEVKRLRDIVKEVEDYASNALATGANDILDWCEVLEIVNPTSESK